LVFSEEWIEAFYLFPIHDNRWIDLNLWIIFLRDGIKGR
jgi:hypothetical protein